MQLTDGRNTQAITGGAEIFFVRHNETDLTGVIGMTKNLRRAITTLAELVDPAALNQLVT
ncbi:Uncharacterised protein [Salmonella enterica subsp. enterica serovar Bovismorbificans]|uniref:Uncharacterized protein n=1 Tax=Salmonella enterica subsp. enterica serovar Bovismorbificans TaxID=58097 RepID=A0A655BPZ8_SALET|nr:Uncharacterised protein [Salmonella enterica subsp. enterica serovar Bovismorbificans]